MHDPIQVLRDLEWIVSSPSLIDFSGCEGVSAVPSFESERLPIEKAACLSSLRLPLKKKVGRYFEQLVSYWLHDVRRLEILTEQQQIFDAGQTVGEIDFIFKDELQQLVHLETAIKFYLYYPGTHSSGSHYLGPNSRDNFEAKTRKLLNHQLKLGRKLEPRLDRVEALVRGRIFYPPDSAEDILRPAHLSQEHLTGHWIYPNEIEWIDQFRDDARFMIMRKPYWLTPVLTESQTSSRLDHTELKRFTQQHFAESSRPLLVCKFDQSDPNTEEVHFFFIVPAAWPN